MLFKIGIIAFLVSFNVYSLESMKCSPWTKQEGYSCIFAGSEANIYKRQCENPCWSDRNGNGNMGPSCDKETVCHISNPDTFSGVCSEWAPVSDVTCYDPSTQSWEQQWVRACTVGIKETWCSRVKPENFNF